MDNRDYKIENIPSEKFAFANTDDILHDKKLKTKQKSYFQDVLSRFAKNKSSVVAAVIIAVLVLFAIIGPMLANKNYVNSYLTDTMLVNYQYLKPRLSFMHGTGIWDGSKVVEVSQNKYDVYRGMEQEIGYPIIEDVISTTTTVDAFKQSTTLYKLRIDTYTSLNTFTQTLTADQYQALQAWQDENEIQVILPRVDTQVVGTNNIWYKSDMKGNAKLDSEGNFIPSYYTTGNDDYTSKMRLAIDPWTEENPSAGWRYAQRTGTSDAGYNYVVRLSAYNYFIYRYGFEPNFVFGTDARGFDIFSRLASGARFSFILAITVSLINLFIGAIYGAVEGYYGGVVDIVMERISDILSGIPFTVVTVLFSLHLASKIGIVPSLLFAFISTGWIGMASRVRMQFYRFKNQEYVLASRTLGASDFRIMFKHIFPNSLGTIITGSVLVIPSVIFSETSLSYLGIINLDSASVTSIGAMLSAGQTCMTSAPHVVFFPALFIALLMISFNLFGNGLRDAFNPSTRGVE
ncbi:MAG TPA: hypothetical protein DEW22_08955 [Clostridiales bacterium]|nr:hypothetical protein [Clostridiales bacterium]